MTNGLKHIISQQYAFINLGDVLVTLTVLPREMCEWFIVNKYWKEVVKIKKSSQAHSLPVCNTMWDYSVFHLCSSSTTCESKYVISQQLKSGQNTHRDQHVFVLTLKLQLLLDKLLGNKTLISLFTYCELTNVAINLGFPP